MKPLLASLLGSLWQAGLIWTALLILNRLIPLSRPDIRHKVAVASLLTVAVCWLSAWWFPPTTAEIPEAAAPASWSGPALVVKDRTITSSPEALSFSWQQALILLWQAGVFCGMVRVVFSIRGASRIRVRSQALTEAAWTGPLRELCHTLSVRGGISLRKCAGLASPVVTGVLRPAIIIPASAVTGVPPEMIRAALAHEIAHLKRWDYLVELAQKLIEALLFFNPFVWMISRCVRTEREACCDRIASQVCSGSLAYSEALLWWGRHAGAQPRGTLALTEDTPGLPGRIRRLLQGGEAFPSLTGWRRDAGFVSLVPLLLLSAAFLHATVSELSPAQRVALMEFLAKPFRERAELTDSQTKRLPFSGVVRDELGNAVPEATWRVLSDRLVDPLFGRTDPHGRFSGMAPEGRVLVVIQAKGFAPARAEYGHGQPRENASLVLSHGTTANVSCVDETGSPIPGATVRLETTEYPYWQPQATTDQKGQAWLPDLPELRSARLTIAAAGFESTRVDSVNLSEADPKKPYTLMRSKPARLRVVDEISGEPVAGAKFRILGTHPEGATFIYPDWNSAGLKTDHHGEVLLPGLNSELTYEMKVEAQNRTTTFRLDPTSDRNRTIILPRGRRLNLKIVNLPPAAGGSVRIESSQWQTQRSSSGSSVEAEIVNGEARATFNGLLPKPVSFHFDNQWVPGPDLTQEVTEFTIDYEKVKLPPKVRITLKAKVARHQAPPAGSYWVNWALSEDAGTWDGTSAPIRNGIAEVDLPANAVFRVNNSELIGGFVDESAVYRASGASRTVEIPVTPAGMIRAKVLEPDGSLANDVFILAESVSRPSESIAIKNSASRGDAKEWFISDPVKLSGKTYQVAATSGLRFAVSRPFKLQSSNPIQDVVLTLPSPQRRTLQVLDENGAPLGGITLSFSMHLPPIGRISGRTVTTDAHGMVTVEVGDRLPEGLEARPLSAQLVPAPYPVDFARDRVPVLALQKGRRLTGRFVNRTKSASFSDLSVSWMDQNGKMSSDRQPLDETGRFDFQNVPDREVFLSTSFPRGTELKGNFQVRPGDQEIVLEIVDQK